MCEKLGANVDMVRHGMGKDPRIGTKFLFPGPGYGGSCFPKDVAALRKMAQRLDMNFNVLDSVAEANDNQKKWASQKVINGLGDPAGKTVAVWGLAFKPGTDDVRETPAAAVINTLLGQGANVVAHDPKAQENFAQDFGSHDRLVYADDAYQALKGAHALVLVTEWSEYRRPNWDKVAELMDERIVFDLRNQYDARDLVSREFSYESIGRPNSALVD
jgi:UDPglucose 6-dehydrogenase